MERRARDQAAVEVALTRMVEAARSDRNIVPPMLEAIEPAVPLAVDAPLAVLPMILSFTFVIAVRVRRARRCTIRGG